MHNGTIFAARKRIKWPGEAAVVVSLVHVHKGTLDGPFELDQRQVPLNTAFLFHAGGDENPATLPENAGKSFQGSIVLGMGFTFDDSDKSGVANPISLMRDLIAKDPRNAERIFPYLGGSELNDYPTASAGLPVARGHRLRAGLAGGRLVGSHPRRSGVRRCQSRTSHELGDPAAAAGRCGRSEAEYDVCASRWCAP